MNIAVITPVYKTPEAWLEKCLASVERQTIACTHFLVSDGDESLNALKFPRTEFIRLPKPHDDFGNAARAIGSVSAIARGYEAIAYLDADNWFGEDHLQQMVDLQLRTGAAVCSCTRNLVDLDGQLLGRCQEVDGEKFVDTSCLLLMPPAFGIVSVWYRMPPSLVAIGDRIVWKAIKDENISRAHNNAPTVNFRTNYRAHYEFFGRKPPSGAKHTHIQMTPSGQFVSASISVSKNVEMPSTADIRVKDRARVSLCMIVKNEEYHLADCLAPVAKLFDEIIVVDTGSTDRTKEVAARHGAKVFDFRWADSFAAARNESLHRASGDWIFWLDADDRLDVENVHKLQRLLKELPEENNAYMMCQWSVPDPSTSSPLIVDQVRLFRNLSKARWRYRVHEQIFLALRDTGAREIGTDIVIRHLGYQEADQLRRKRERNIRLLRMDLEENPRDAFVLFNLANVLMDQGEAEQSLPFLHCCIENAPARVSFLSRAFFLLTVGYHLLGRDEEAMRHCREGKKIFPDAADLLFEEGVLLLAQGALNDARKSFERILELAPQKNYVGIDANMSGYRTRHNLAIVYRGLGLPAKAEEQWRLILDQTPDFGPAWLALVELFLDQKRLSDTGKLLDQLRGKSYAESIAPALQARLALATRSLDAARQILEEAVIRTPKAVWMRLFLADMLLRVAKDEVSAEKHLRVVLDIAPNEPQARLRLAQMLASRGR